MKIKYRNAITFFSGILVTTASLAHDPSEHQGKMEKPRCEAMQGMDHSKMDASDPVVMAMLKKCAKDRHGESHQGGSHQGGAHQGGSHQGGSHHGEDQDEGADQ